MDSVYIPLSDKAIKIATGEIPSWKRSPELQTIFEHVVGQHASMYISKLVNRNITRDTIQTYSTLCDSIGDPDVGIINLVKTSSTCIRYLYHAFEIVDMLGKEPLPIVEIGAGYGGLAVAIDFVCKMRGIKVPKYIILDLPNMQKLQEFYLNKFELGFPVEFPTSISEPCFLVSNYALSEIGESIRQMYIETVVKPYAKYGFLVWNAESGFDVFTELYTTTIREEFPQTGACNKIIRFYSPEYIPSAFKSQAGQDKFVYAVTKKNNGTFLEVGGSHPVELNNSHGLEKIGWSGYSFDINPDLACLYKELRTSEFITTDVSKFNWSRFLRENNLTGTTIDYLSFDVDEASMATLRIFPFNEVKFNVMTVEHDKYRFGQHIADEMRHILQSHGYEIICKDVCNVGQPFEDWYVSKEFLLQNPHVEAYRCEGKEWSEIIQTL